MGGTAKALEDQKAGDGSILNEKNLNLNETKEEEKGLFVKKLTLSGFEKDLVSSKKKSKNGVDYFGCHISENDFINALNVFCARAKSMNGIRFVQAVPVDPKSKVCFVGDLDGGIMSLVQILKQLVKGGYLKDDLTIINPNFFMVFLGNYVNYSSGGVPVLYLLTILSIVNPGKIFLIRGKNEHAYMNSDYGFNSELRARYSSKTKGIDWLKFNQAIGKFYSCLPSALFISIQDDYYLGHNYIHCSSGGIDPFFDANAFVASKKEVDSINPYKKSEPFLIQKEGVDYYPYSHLPWDYAFVNGVIRQNYEGRPFKDSPWYTTQNCMMYGAMMNIQNSTCWLALFVHGHDSECTGYISSPTGGYKHWKSYVLDDDLPKGELRVEDGAVITFSTACDDVVYTDAPKKNQNVSYGIVSCLPQVSKETQFWPVTMYEFPFTKLK